MLTLSSVQQIGAPALARIEPAAVALLAGRHRQGGDRRFLAALHGPILRHLARRSTWPKDRFEPRTRGIGRGGSLAALKLAPLSSRCEEHAGTPSHRRFARPRPGRGGARRLPARGRNHPAYVHHRSHGWVLLSLAELTMLVVVCARSLVPPHLRSGDPRRRCARQPRLGSRPPRRRSPTRSSSAWEAAESRSTSRTSSH